MHKSETQSLSPGLFTSCPECSRQFRIQAAQLSMAAGVVKCGMCGHQFNALSRLSDAPLSHEYLNSDAQVADKNLENTETERESEADSDTASEFSRESGLETDIESGQLSEPEFDVPAAKIEIAAIFRAGETEEEAEADSGEQDEADKIPLLSELPDELEEDLPDEYRDAIPEKRSLLATLAWGLGVFLLLIIIIAQLAWFNRDELLTRYPQLDPYAKIICERLHCVTLRHKDISAIKLLNRDVRNHPLFAGNLLVNATMVNQAETIQPYPLIQLALFNNVGEVIGYREFKPEEYLDDSINIPAGMQPQSPIHFVLEVSGPVEDAVSFEFHFL